MADDWTWFFSGEYGRDRILRRELEGLSAASAAADARSTRLTSRLNELQGSLDARLTALSSAFDAYVELGDVREQLAVFGDVAVVRREAVAAVETMAAGRTPEPLPTADSDYWLPYTVNAAAALVSGHADPAAEQAARERSRDADLFLVALLGGLGRGELVADRVPELLVSDGALRRPQVLIWQAVLAGLYPDREAVLDAVGARWHGALAAPAAEWWQTWARGQARSADDVGTLEWLRTLLDGGPVRPVHPGANGAAETAADPRRPLQGIASLLIAEGSDAERALIARARQLRQRIENPGAVPVDDLAAESAVEVRDLVLDALAGADPALRDRWLRWIRPGLRQVVGAIAATAVPLPQPEQVTTRGGAIAVTPAGPDPDRLAAIAAGLAAARPDSSRPQLAWAALLAVTAVCTVITAVAGAGAGWVTVAVLGALAGLGGLIKSSVQRSSARRELAADQDALQRSITVGRERAEAARDAYERHLAAVDQLARELRVRLQDEAAAPVPHG